MRKFWANTPLFATLLIAVSAAAGQSTETKPNIDGLAWIAGCWQMSVPQRNMTVTEHWMRPEGGMMIGMGRTVVGGRTVSYEFLRIAFAADGIDYIAKPSSNKEETAFRLGKFSSTEAVFENPAHDFPQRIIYRKSDADSLFARIEGMRNGKASGMDIPMKRVKCD